MSKLFAFILIAFAATAPAAHARVHSVPVFQTLQWPLGGEFPNFLAQAVGIDGDSIVILVDNGGDGAPGLTNRVALLYRRGTDGSWAYSRILTQVTAPREELRAELAMKNNVAVVKIHRDIATVWEKTGGNWVQAAVTNGLREPGGFAISGSRILAGSSGCDNDGVIYEKSAANNHWVITGRIAPDAGVCADQARAVELNYDYAFIRSSPTVVRSYRKNGSALVWPANRLINLPSQAAPFPGPVAVQLSSAVTPGSAYFTRGTNWDYAGQLMPLDYAMGTGEARKVIFRDGVVLIYENWDAPSALYVGPYVYAPNSAGGFDHVGILQGVGTFINDFDISGRTIVSASGTEFGSIQGNVSVYVLPTTLVAPPAIPNNFDARDISGLTITPGTFVLAQDGVNSTNYVLRRPGGSNVDAAAVFNNTNWRDFQYIEADVRPTTFSGSDGWYGVAVRYVDSDNYYFAGVSGINTFQLGRKVNGVFTILDQLDIDVPPNPTYQIGLSIYRGQLIAALSGAADAYLQAEDASLTQGRAALATHNASGDADNVYVVPTASTKLFSQQYPEWVFGRELRYIGGNWHIGVNTNDYGLQQSDTTGNAFAIVPGPALDNQSITADAILDSFGSTNPVAWFGVVVRYVDARNYYYLSVRSSGQLQIRKVVNGAVTPLKGVSFTVTPGSTHRYAFKVLGNELTASVDGTVRLRVNDNSLPRGQYGLATYRAGARYRLVSASQP